MLFRSGQIRALRTILRQKDYDISELQRKPLHRLLDRRDAEIKELEAALARATAQLMGEPHPQATKKWLDQPPRDTRTFPWDPPTIDGDKIQ